MKVIFFILLTVTAITALNNRPIIGILTQPTGESLRAHGDSYIAASYVKYVEAGGGRAVPIFHNSTEEELKAFFSKINGILFPGGGSSLQNTPLYKSGALLFAQTLKAKEEGQSIPIFAHCMGFELEAIIASQDFGILTPVDAEDITLPLNFTQQARENKKLHEFFTVLSTNVDRQGKEFISTWEAKEYPIFGMQWHPEKPQYEWDPKEVINHSAESIRANQFFAEALVNEARKNSHHFPTEEEEYNALIYNYSPIYSQKATGSFEQAYVF